MFRVLRRNAVILGAYCVVSTLVFIAALMSSSFRSLQPLSYAPLRELVLPPPEPVVLSILYSTEKEDWLREVTASFEAGHPLSSGHPIRISLKSMGSREMYLAVLDGTERPDVISPASSMQVAILQDLSARKWGRSVVNPADTATCRSLMKSPLVMVAWQERAAALWGDAPGPRLWRRLHDVLVEPKGWAAYEHPEWSYLKFAHTDPLKSNSGLMTILLMAYDYFDKTSGLTAPDLSDEGYQRWATEMERSISQFADSTGPLLKDMVNYGPSRYDFVAAYEASAVAQAFNAPGRYGNLKVYYPETTVLSDHPFCILQADWVTPDEASAARIYLDYLSNRQAQELALLKYGFRPADAAIAVDGPDSPFRRLAANGFRMDAPPVVEMPPGDVLNKLLDSWSRTSGVRR